MQKTHRPNVIDAHGMQLMYQSADKPLTNAKAMEAGMDS
jgi:hypothetical protein